MPPTVYARTSYRSLLLPSQKFDFFFRFYRHGGSELSDCKNELINFLLLTGGHEAAQWCLPEQTAHWITRSCRGLILQQLSYQIISSCAKQDAWPNFFSFFFSSPLSFFFWGKCVLPFCILFIFSPRYPPARCSPIDFLASFVLLCVTLQM